MNRLYEYYDVTGGSDFITSGFVGVFHYDPSTFYNYSQDNLAVTSLESRYDNLAQAVGFPGTQTYSGVTLVVSSTGTESDISGVYATVQAAVDSLPRILNYPVTIQVSDYGNMGELSIVGIKCVGAGAIQIESLNYSSDTQGTVQGVAVRGDLSSVSSINSTVIDSSIRNAVDSRYGNSTFNDSNWKTYGRAFGQRSPDTEKETQVLSFAAPHSTAAWNFSSTDATFIVEQYQQYSATVDTSISADIVPQNADGESLLRYRDFPVSGDLGTAIVFGSYFSSITVKDCNRLKLKGILVDGVVEDSSDFQYSSTIGLRVSNSNILLEDFAVTRCATHGILSTNSKLNISKSFIVHRIYNKVIGGAEPTLRGIGVDLYNSNLVFDTNSIPYAGRYMRIITEGCRVGLSCHNSLVCGGTWNQIREKSYVKNAGGLDTITAHFQISRNSLGFLSNNSTFDFDGRFNAFLNLSGIDVTQSNLLFPQFSIDDNQEYGIKLNSSNLFYGKHNDFLNAFGGTNMSGAPLYHCDYNGINLIAFNNSHVSIDRSVSSYASVGSWGGNTPLTSGDTTVASNSLMRNFGVKEGSMVPAVLIDLNSTAHLIGLGYTGDINYSRDGAAVVASRNSNVVLHGFGSRWTTLTSNGDVSSNDILKKLWTSAAVVARRNSKVSFIGPVKISRYGVSVLCQDSSTSYFGPPSELENGLNIVKYGLTDTSNHTKVELHSNRACIVATNNSKIRMYGLGAPATTPSTYGPIEFSERFNESTKESYVALMPNGFTELSIQDESLSGVVLGGNIDRFTRNEGLVSDYSTEHMLGCTGGMCVRAVDNSDIDVDLVNFKFGMDASSVSGVMYNWNGSGTEFIDNADNYVDLSPKTDPCWIANLCCDCETTTSTPTLTGTATASAPTTTIYSTTPTTPFTTTSTTAYTTTPTVTITDYTTTASTLFTTTSTTAYSTTRTSTFTTTSTLTNQTTTLFSTTASTLFTTTSTLTNQTTTIYSTTPTTEFTTTATTAYTTTPTSTITDYTTTVSTLFTTTRTNTFTTTATTAFTTTATTLYTTTSTTGYTTTITTAFTTSPTLTTTQFTTTSTSTYTTTRTNTFTTTATTAFTTTSTLTATPTTTFTTSRTSTFTTTATTAFTTTSTLTNQTTTLFSTTASTLFTTTSTLTNQTTTLFSTTATTAFTTTSTLTATPTTLFTTTATTAFTTTSTLTATPTTTFTTSRTSTFTTTATTEFTTTATTPFTTTITTSYTTTATTAYTTTNTGVPTTSTAQTLPSTVSTVATIPTLTIGIADGIGPIDNAGGGVGQIPQNGDGEFIYAASIDYKSFGTKIHIWNVCDYSRIRVSRVLLNGNDTKTECVNNDWHGPTGRWWTGAACDYYGKYGYAAVKRFEENAFRNHGIFRLIVGGDGDLKMLEETEALPLAYFGTSIGNISGLEGGSPYDQVNGQGYMMTSDHAFTLSDITFASAINEYSYVTNDTKILSAVLAFGAGLPGYFQSPGKLNGSITHARMNDGNSMRWDEGQLHPELIVPPIRMKWSGYLDNRVDESAASLFSNARHAANKKVNLLTLYDSSTGTGGEGRTSLNTTTSFGLGVRSLNIFELNQLV